MAPNSNGYDVFLSYNWRDHGAVETVAGVLREQGLSVFLDRWYVAAGRPWAQLLDDALEPCGAVAVFLGTHGMGHWQQREKNQALERQAQDTNFPVIPVLLPGADPALEFLSINTWVDLRTGLDDPLPISDLTSAIRGDSPGTTAQERISSTLANVCPYRGLQPFREEDAPFFFGREAFVGRLVDSVRQHSLVALVGASGSGKSSVVRAGLVPALSGGVEEGAWDSVTIVPGDRPLHSLAAGFVPLLEPDLSEIERLAAVGKLAGFLADGQVSLRDLVTQVMAKQASAGRSLLIVDQLEELYTQSRDDQANRRFLDELLDATANGPLSVVFTLRGDFFGQALGYRPLADRLQDAVVNLGPMNSEELERAVAAPAQKVGLTLEAGLVTRILEDVEQEPGNLPLLEFLLTDLWEARREDQLTHEAYNAIGGVQGAMAQRAEDLFRTLESADQRELRRVFTQLVMPGEDTQDTRRRATFSELGENAQRIVSQLTEARLLVTGLDEAIGEETVEVAHEALIGNWDRLRAWLDEDREYLLWRNRLRVALNEWNRGGRDRGLLLRSAPLAEATQWLAQRLDDLNPSEQAFIHRSIAQRGRHRTYRWAGAVGITVLALMVVGVLVVQRNIAVASQSEAETQRQAVLARELAAQSQLADTPRLQVLLGIESLRRYSGLEGVSPLEGDQALRTGLALFARPVATMSHDDALTNVVFSPDGKMLATSSWDYTARTWEAETGRELSRLVHDDVVAHRLGGLDWGPNSRRLVTASRDGLARVWDTVTGQEISSISHPDFNMSAALSPDGRWVASSAGARDKTTKVWDADSGQVLFTVRHATGSSRVIFAPDSSWLASGGDSAVVKVFYLPDGREMVLGTHQENIYAFAVSQGGRFLASGSLDDTAKVWDVAAGEEIARLDHDGNVVRLDFSPDGKWLATASADKFARVWEVPTGREVARMGHEGVVRAVTFSPDGKSLATAGDEKFARIWEVATGRELARMTHDDFVKDLDFSPDGRWLATASDDGTARVWEAASGQAVRMPHEDLVNALDLSADGRLVASGSFDNTARVWNTETGREIARVSHEDDVADVALNSDGKWLATASFDSTVGIWEADTGKPVARMDHQDFVLRVVFSPDSKLLASASNDKSVKVWETSTGREVARMDQQSRAFDLAFSPDGRWLAIGRDLPDAAARVWDVATGELVSQMEHQNAVGKLPFGPDGRLLATAGDEGIPRIWDSATGQEIARMSHLAWVNDLAFSPNGQYLATASFDKTAKVWESETGQEVASIAHENQVTLLAFSPDGMWLATSGRDRVTRVTEIDSGIEMARIVHDDAVTDLAFSPQGKYLATSSADGASYLWLVRPEDLIAEACARISRNFTAAEWQQFLGSEPYRPTCADLPSLGS